MRWKIPAGVVMALAFLVPAAPAVAQTASPAAAETTCQTIVYTDIRTLVTIDIDTASTGALRLLAYRVLAAANRNSLTTLPGEVQAALSGTVDDLRAFLKTELQPVWSLDLRVAVADTVSGAGANVAAAGKNALKNGTVDALLAYLNDGLYIARATDAGSYKAVTDVRELAAIDVDAASDAELRLLAYRVLAAVTGDSLTTSPGAVQTALNGTADELRAFLKSKLQVVWSVDLRIKVNQTFAGAGPNVLAAAQSALDNGTTDALLAYLNHGIYRARSLDCVYQPAASATD
jgi:hypothetical protein